MTHGTVETGEKSQGNNCSRPWKKLQKEWNLFQTTDNVRREEGLVIGLKQVYFPSLNKEKKMFIRNLWWKSCKKAWSKYKTNVKGHVWAVDGIEQKNPFDLDAGTGLTLLGKAARVVIFRKLNIIPALQSAVFTCSYTYTLSWLSTFSHILNKKHRKLNYRARLDLLSSLRV